MRLAIDIWEAARRRRCGAGSSAAIIMDRRRQWDPASTAIPSSWTGSCPIRPTGSSAAWIASTHLGDDVHGRFVRGDLVKPALHYLQSKVNEKLEGRASPRLLWDKKRERLGLYIVPEGMIGALWLQFARAVERDSRFRQCAECGIWSSLPPAPHAPTSSTAPHPAGPRPIASARQRQRGCTARGNRSRTSPASWTAIPTRCAAGSNARGIGGSPQSETE